jgi:hypothetical protein
MDLVKNIKTYVILPQEYFIWKSINPKIIHVIMKSYFLKIPLLCSNKKCKRSSGIPYSCIFIANC